MLWTELRFILEAAANFLMEIWQSELTRDWIFSLFSSVRADFFWPELPRWRSFTEPSWFHFFKVVLIVLRFSSKPKRVLNFLLLSAIYFVWIINSTMKILSWMLCSGAPWWSFCAITHMSHNVCHICNTTDCVATDVATQMGICRYGPLRDTC